MIKNSHPMRFTPTGLVDAFDASQKFIGACQQMQNLVFDQANPELVVSRPGVVTLVNLADGGIVNPAFISIQVTIGTRVYGMVASSRNPGHDEPFIYDTGTGSFVTVGGTINNSTTPLSPATGGDWTPPTIANMGTMVIVTHPGFPGGVGNYFGWFDVSTYATPVWHAGNTATNALPAVPIAVANFNDRAYFVVANGAGQPYNQVEYTDVLTNPPTVTNATQILTIGDNQAITALVGLPLTTTSSGIIQSLTIFKATQIWQVTGDTTTFDLSLAYVSINIGTAAPRSVAQSPYGIYFAGAGGPYFLDQLGIVRAVANSGQSLEPDVNAAFQNAITPSRWAAGYIATTYRITGETTLNGLGQVIDYWFDEHKRRWNGPHTFQYDCCSVVGGVFVLSSVNNPGQLMQSQPYQQTDSVYEDLGSSYNAILQTSTFPKTNDELMKQVAESTIELSSSLGPTLYNIVAQNEEGKTMGTVDITVTEGGVPWGSNIWGDGSVWTPDPHWGGGAVWGLSPPAGTGSGLIWGQGSQVAPRTYPVWWAAPLVFNKMQLQITALASANIGIGTFYARYQQTGYQVWRPGTQTQTIGPFNGL